MIASPQELFDTYESARAATTSVIFQILSQSGHISDDDLAHLIDVDARQAPAGTTYSLGAFLDAIPDLRQRPVVLDAAIDAVIRTGNAVGRSTDDIARDLAAKHPDLMPAIEAAVALSSLFVTDVARTGASQRENPHGAPATDFGPAIAAGRPRYSIRDRLGAGKQGSVYLAADLALSSEQQPVFVAAKFLHARDGTTAEARHRSAEAFRARRVVHPNVARALDRGYTPDARQYVVFEYVEGGTLQGKLEASGGAMTPRDAVALITRVARGLQAIHSAGLLHCDLKPGNVLLDLAGEPRITDFGLARNVQPAPGAEASSESFGGTLGFAAPEQFVSSETPTVMSDTYALAGLLVWLLTGAVPNGETPAIARGHLDQRSTRGTVNPMIAQKLAERSIDHDLAAVCVRSLDRDPHQRHSSAEAFAADLERWARHEPLTWVKSPWPRRTVRWLKREWRQISFAAVTAAIVITATAAVAKANRDAANQRELARQADLAKAQERGRLQNIQQNAKAMLESVSLMRRTMSAEDWLASLTFLENISGPTSMFDSAQLGKLSESRIRSALDLAATSRNSGGAPSIASVQWRVLAGFWSLNRDDYKSAADCLAAARDDLLILAPSDTGLIDLVEKLLAASLVLDPRPSPGTRSDRSLDTAWARDVLAHSDTAFVKGTRLSVRNIIERARQGAR